MIKKIIQILLKPLIFILEILLLLSGFSLQVYALQTVVYDEFTASDGTNIIGRYPSPVSPGNSYSLFGVSGTNEINNNFANIETSGSGFIIDSGSTDYQLSFDWTPQTGVLDRYSAIFRYKDSNEYWYWNFREDFDDIQLVYVNNGYHDYKLSSYSYTFNDNTTYNMQLRDDGTSIYLNISGNGIGYYYYTDLNTYSVQGLQRNSSDGVTKLDNFTILDYSSTPTPTPTNTPTPTPTDSPYPTNTPYPTPTTLPQPTPIPGGQSYTTDWTVPTSEGNIQQWAIGLSQIISDDGTYGNINCLPSNSPCLNSWKYDFNDVIDGKTIEKIEIKNKYKTQYNLSNSGFYVDISIDDTIGNAYSPLVNSITDTDWHTEIFEYNNISQYFGSNFDDDNFSIIGGADKSGTESNIFWWDYNAIRITYSDYIGSLGTITYEDDATNSARLIHFDDFDTGTSSATMLCEVGIYPICSNDYQTIENSFPATYIEVYDQEPNPTTTIYDNGRYRGYDWYYNDSTFDGTVEVPLEYGYTCTYKYELKCYEDENTVLQEVIYHDVENTITEEEECGTGIDSIPCHIIKRLQDALVYLFVPNSRDLASTVASFQNTLNYNAPFAYFNHIKNLEWNLQEHDDYLNLSIPVSSGNNGIPPTIEAEIDENHTAFAWVHMIRGALGTIVSLLVFAYFVLLVKRAGDEIILPS